MADILVGGAQKRLLCDVVDGSDGHLDSEVAAFIESAGRFAGVGVFLDVFEFRSESFGVFWFEVFLDQLGEEADEVCVILIGCLFIKEFEGLANGMGMSAVGPDRCHGFVGVDDGDHFSKERYFFCLQTTGITAAVDFFVVFGDYPHAVGRQGRDASEVSAAAIDMALEEGELLGSEALFGV